MSEEVQTISSRCTAPLTDEDGELRDCGEPAVLRFAFGKGVAPMLRCAAHGPKTRDTLKSYVRSFAEQAIE